MIPRSNQLDLDPHWDLCQRLGPASMCVNTQVENFAGEKVNLGVNSLLDSYHSRLASPFDLVNLRLHHSSSHRILQIYLHEVSACATW